MGSALHTRGGCAIRDHEHTGYASDEAGPRMLSTTKGLVNNILLVRAPALKSLPLHTESVKQQSWIAPPAMAIVLAPGTTTCACTVWSGKTLQDNLRAASCPTRKHLHEAQGDRATTPVPRPLTTSPSMVKGGPRTHASRPEVAEVGHVALCVHHHAEERAQRSALAVRTRSIGQYLFDQASDGGHKYFYDIVT